MLLTYYDMLCIYKMWYVTFPLRMFWLKIILTRFSWFHFVVPEVQVGCFVKKFSKFTTINVSPFWGQKSRLLIIFGQRENKRNVLPLPTQICTARSRKNTCSQMLANCLFNRTNFAKCILQTKFNFRTKSCQ